MKRKLTVYSSYQTNTTTYYHTEYKEVPMIRLQGMYLSSAGFNPSDKITVTISKGQIGITKNDSEGTPEEPGS